MAVTQLGRQLYLGTPLGPDYLLVNKIRGTEGLSQLFSFELELLHEENENNYQPTVVDPQKILGQGVTIGVNLLDDDMDFERYFNGLVIQFSQGQRDIRFSHYRAVIVPEVWTLTQIKQSRIFQHQNIPDILKKVFAGYNVSYELQGNFEQRNYCVQYQETDFDFASRLMEEEGIFYYFEHGNGFHKMVVANTPQSHRDCPGKKTIPFALDASGPKEFVSAISRWKVQHQLQTGKHTLWDYHFQLPTQKLDAEQPSRFNIGGNQDLEVYEFPGGYARRFDGISKDGGEQSDKLQKVHDDKQRTTQIRQQEIDAQFKTVSGQSDCIALTVGHRFKLINHPNNENNIQHVVVSLEHEIEQSPSYQTEEPAPRSYINRFTCLPHGAGHAPYRPPRRTAKPTVRGCQTAVVVGPAGEEIFTDKYGRVKVQFHWDRQSTADAGSSCWLRMAHSIAGNKWGSIYIPRVGQEVMVDFLEGDPDQPIIVGSVYNPEHMPPYELPAEKTKTVMFKSFSSKGGGGFNELRIEDKKGSEQIFLHGEKDQDVRIKNDSMEYIGNNRHLIVKKDQLEKVTGDKHLQIGGDQNEKVDGTVSLKVGQDVQEKVGVNYAVDAGMEIHLKAGMNVVLESGTTLTLKVGANFININSAGIFIKGNFVMLNSGGAAVSGKGASPDAPKDPKEADKAEPGSKTAPAPRTPPTKVHKYTSATAMVLKKAAKAGTPFCEICERNKKK